MFNVKDLLRFDRMLTPTIIQILYFILLGIALLAGLSLITLGIRNEYGGGGLQVLFGLITIVFGPIFVRIVCELLMLVFRIYGVAVEIRDSLPGTQTTGEPHPRTTTPSRAIGQPGRE